MKRWNVELCASHAPWKSEFEDGYGWCVLSARDEIVAYIPQSIVHDEPNARLIAAAPELLTALERLLSVRHDPMCLEASTAYGQAHEVIAKAKGGAL